MLGLAFVAVGSFCRQSFACASIRCRPSGFSSPAPMSFPHAGTSSEFPHPRASPSSPSLPSEGQGGGGGLGLPLCCFPRVCLSSRSTFVQREGWRSLWSLVRCTQARFCLLSSFVGWGSRSCSFAAESCYPLCLSWLSILNSARPAR